ncbi:hypothetical protein [Dyella sp. C11]|uniref:hypothetical protein n=1 Tax=Dyella sp. C11 TaxID=2126991 RepID=UPI000D644429|nr:hypothetical protein [Dyella sp. C11]
MAIRDHKARARPSFPDDGTFRDPTGNVPAVSPPFPYDRIDTAMAVLTLVRLHGDSERYRKAKAWGFPAKPLAFPLPAEVAAALQIAIHCLEHMAYGPGHASALHS